MNRVTSMINRKVLSVGAVLVMLTAFGTGIYFLEERFARAEDLKQSNQNLKQHILDQKQVNLEGLKIRLERDIHQPISHDTLLPEYILHSFLYVLTSFFSDSFS